MRRGDSEQVVRQKHIWLFPALLCLGVIGYLIAGHGFSERPPVSENERETPVPKAYPREDQLPKFRQSDRADLPADDAGAIVGGAIPNQRAIVFKDSDTLEGFLAKLGNGVTLLGRLDKLNALLVGFTNESDLAALLDGSEQSSMIYPVNIPAFESTGAQAGALGLGDGLLKWLGVAGDNSLWGKGVKIAVLDTGIADHIAFKNPILRINFVPWPENPADLNGHGTAVATLIFSNNAFAPGIAPAATPLSIRIADDNGSSNSFLISQGIIAAVDEGAQIINISLGGSGKSGLVETALDYARQRGVVVVAAAGNSGTEGVMQPAANPSVIAVGAVDAKNQHLAFSTTGSEVAISAPGFEVNVAYPDDKAARVNGTSFSAPIITGAIGAAMSNSGSQALNATAALSALNRNLNDIGVQGRDDSTGAGVPDMWRILNADRPGLYDAAITSVYTVDDSRGSEVRVLIQNQGTETIVNAGVSINVNGNSTQANITSLAVGDTRVISVPVNVSENLNIQSSVQLSGGQTDQRPSNDSLTHRNSNSGP
ncbi:MAG: S8 family serine peptidase [Armatimonadetes bacterium]|nr:S8 family serine peptidase [Akkermansiaceae bacterium]